MGLPRPEERRSKSLYFSLPWAVLAIFLLAVAQFFSSSRSKNYLSVYSQPAMQEYALLDVSAVLMGLRRLGADLSFVQMLQYYASMDWAGHREDEHGHAVEGSADVHPEVRLTQFPLLKDYVLRSAALDPYFHYVYLFGAGALAFNLNRTDEALEVLKRGSEVDPHFWQYRLYAGAIAYRRSFQLDKVIDLLEEAFRYPDCPSMLQNILAILHKRQGNFERAAEIYRHMIETSRDSGYVSLARQRLRELQEQGFLRPGE